MSSMKHQKSMTSSRMTSKAPSILGKGQFSIFLPRRMDSEYYVKSPVKVKAEMFLFPKQLGAGGLCLRSIPCSAKVQKLTEDNHFDIVNVPIKIEAEVLLSPGFNYSSRTSTPHNGATMEPQCLIKIIEPNQRPHEGGEGWQFQMKKTKDELNNFKELYCMNDNKTKGVLVEELKLSDNSQRTKDLSRQLNSYLNQVLEQNKQIQKLQEQLRQEESKEASSIEKVQIAEQQLKLLDQRLKATECRAKSAEHRAEAFKQRTKILSIACRHQGIQLKDLARHMALFAKTLEAQKLQAISKKEIIQQKVRDPQESLNARDATTCSTPVVEDSSMCNTTKPPNYFTEQNLFPEIETNARENSPDLNSPSTRCFYQTITVQELNDKYVLFLCRRPPKDHISHRIALEKEEKLKAATLLESENPHSTSKSLVIPTQTAELLFNQYLEMPPNWPMEFASSIQRAEELVKRCFLQALKLKDLSKDLDCFPQKPTRGNHSTTSMSSASTSPSNLKGKVRSIGEDGLPSHQSTPFNDIQGDHQALLTNNAHQTNTFEEGYPLNPARTNETLAHKQTLQQIDAWIQTIPILPTVEVALNNYRNKTKNSPQETTQCQVLFRSWFPYRYEVKAWRIASRTLIQGILLWLGLLLLPQVSLFQHSPPPT